MKILPETTLGKIRAIVVIVVLVVLVGCFYCVPAKRYMKYDPQEGDVVFQALPGGGMLVRVIEGVSESEYSHCGVVLKEDGGWVVIEAIGEVRTTPLFEWIRRGRSAGWFAAYRLKPEYRKNIPAFRAELEKFIGVPYDYHYGMSDDEIYCSELVFTAYRNATGEQLGELKKLKDLNWKPFEADIKEIEGGPVPLEREIITPKNLSEAQQFEKVAGGDF